MRNPYTAALVRASENARNLAPAHQAQEKPACPERINAFFEAMEINHAGNRAKVCTAIAHTMKAHELKEAIQRLQADSEERAVLLERLNAPAIIVTNERLKHRNPIGILTRVLNKR